ncbi:MAG TPA: aminotransferase class I/II-fold pyridoxal phosphate-dependent enzyme [Vicinamibacterales bacterium]|nr:aminotransferase class I/II-fold pyridoxal phosphate-dependent enzyme [Vicinamibacterales bacterium]
MGDLDLPRGRRDALGRAALDWVQRYFDEGAAGPLYPQVTAAGLNAQIAETLPEAPQDAQAVLAQFADLATLGRKNGHPRMFGYVQSSAAFAGVIGDFLASALNQNLTSWRSSPSATTIELQVIDWVKALVGFAPTGGGLLVSGGSMANFAALAAAVRASSGVDVNQHGVGALPGAPRIYTSAMTHMSIGKSAALLGIGRDAIRTVPVDANFRVRVDALREMLRADRAAGDLPVCVVGNAGEVNTGAIDPLDDLATLCADEKVWFHIDGAYGGFAAGVPALGDAMRGRSRADSMSLDPHKWLFAPVDVGCLLVRDIDHLRRTFSHGAAYIDVIAGRGMSDFAFWDYGPELTRRFRALKLWFIFKCHGAAALRDAMSGNIAVAQELAAAIDASPDFKRLAPVPLSIVCFRYLPPGMTDPEAINAFNKQLMVAVQLDGDSYLSNAMLGSTFALRACIVNFRTSPDDVERLLATIRRIATGMLRS